MAAPRAKPSYDELAASLRAHRVEMRVVHAFMNDCLDIDDGRYADLVRVLAHTTPQDLLFSLDPVGGDAPETAEATRTQLRFEQAVGHLAEAKTGETEKTEKTEKTENTEAPCGAMGVGKGRGSQRSQPY
jgi:hypothetical protein